MLDIITNLLNKYQKELSNTKNPKEILETKKKHKQLLIVQSLIEEQNELKKQHTLTDDKEFQKILFEEINIIQDKINLQFIEFKNNVLSEQQKIILEIRSGEGGQEAELFALELLEMYQKLSKKMNWKFIPFEISYKESGGIKDCTIEIIGQGVEKWLYHESGVHCVKRVPQTEKKGRIHTSTATIAVLKQPNTIEVHINETDLKIEVFRSSGPGGQSVNTTDSAVRITHIPTGIVVSQQDEKSQIKNKEKALKILKARIYNKKLEEEHEKNAEERRSAIGNAKRNERIRTYHFIQNWISDSRIKIKSHSIQKFMESEDLYIFLNELILSVL